MLDCSDLQTRSKRIGSAVAALRRGDIAVAPDQNMYTLICDAFSQRGVEAVRGLKSHSKQPLSVLVGRPVAVDGVASNIPKYARDLMSAFWPGPLTLLLRQQPSLMWPLRAPGLAVRMPLHPVMLELTRELGPTAATSANPPGSGPISSHKDFEELLTDEVDIFLDAGPVSVGERSTVVDATNQDLPVLKRTGGISVEALAEVCPDLGQADD